jgi:hypothetical protein
MNRSFIALVGIVVAGCAVPPVQTYDGPPKPAVEIAIVRSVGEGAYRGRFSSYARHIRDQKLEFQSVGNSLTGYPTEIHLVPGHYLILVRCDGGGGYGFPSVDFDVLPGMTYEISCESAAVGNKREGSHREAAVWSVPAGGGGGGGYVPSGNHSSRGAAFTSGFVSGLSSGLANASQSPPVQLGTVRAFLSQRYPTAAEKR